MASRSRIEGITVQIGGDTTGLSKALGGLNREINTTQAQLKDVERLLKLDPKNTELLKQKQELLGEAIEKTKTKLDSLKEAEKQVQQQVKEGTATQEQYDKLRREIIDTENALKALETQAANSAVALVKIGQAGESLQIIGDKITGVGKALAPLSAATAAGGVAIGKMASNFEDAMAKVSTIADESEMSLEDMEKAIMELSNQTGVSSAEIANNVYDAISAGQKTGDAVNFVSNAASLARAGFAETGDALDLLTTIMNAYGLEAEDVTRVSDILINTQNLGKTTVAQLASAMGKAIPTAKANGVSIENLSSAYAVMTSNGIATAETTTYLNSMLNELGKQGTSAANAFAAGTEHIKEGGLTMKEAMDMGWELTDVLSILDEQAAESGTSIANMFGSAEAGKAANVLFDNAEKLNEVVEQMGGAAGATDEALGKLDTTSYKVEKSVNQLKNSGIELGQTLLEELSPHLDRISEIIGVVTQKFSSLDDETKNMIITIGLIVAAAAPVLIIIGKITSGIGGLMITISKVGPTVTKMGETFSSVFSFIAANPIVILIAAIVALVALIAAKGDEAQAILQNIDDFLQGVFLVDWTQVFGPGLGDAINAFFANVKNVWDSIKKILDGIIDFIRGVFTGDWERAWNGVKSIFSGIFEGLEAIAKAPLNGIIGLMNGLVNGVNWVIDKINSISIDIPDWLGGGHIGFSLDRLAKIPYLAKGGILTKGSAIVGDAGPELLTLAGGQAVVQPLTNQTTNNSTNLGGINITVYGAPGQDVNELAEIISEKISDSTARLGEVYA